jgi:hypothetical protein
VRPEFFESGHRIAALKLERDVSVHSSIHDAAAGLSDFAEGELAITNTDERVAYLLPHCNVVPLVQDSCRSRRPARA